MEPLAQVLPVVDNLGGAGTGSSAMSLSTFEGRLEFARFLRRYGSRELGALAGLSSGGVSKLERAGADPKVSTVRALAAALQCAPEWLAWGSGPAPTETSADRARTPPTPGSHRPSSFFPVVRATSGRRRRDARGAAP